MSREQQPSSEADDELTSAAFMVRITVLQGRCAGTIRDVRQFPAVIGRGKDVDVPLVEDTKLSRQHVRIWLKGGCLLVEDISTNGTWIDERLIGPNQTVLLAEGGEVALGPHTVIRLQVLPDAPQAARVAPPGAPAKAPSGSGSWLMNLIRPKKPDSQHVVEIRALGRFRMTVDGMAIDDSAWQHRKAIVLLVHLADSGVATSADRLHEILWPDAADGRQVVQTAVSRLRKTLRTGPQTSDLVILDRKLYALDPAFSIWYDVAEFELWIREAQRLWSERKATEAGQTLECAFDLYRGDFLEGFDEGWAVRRRTHLARSRFEALELMGVIREHENRPDEAVRVYQSVLELDPGRETAHIGLVRSMAASGRRDDAIRQCRDSMVTLKKLLNLPPSPQLEALYYGLSRNPGS